jgi:hypothetical protein
MPVLEEWRGGEPGDDAGVRSKIAVPVVSEPVPAVVGMAIRGRRARVMGWPSPSGAGMNESSDEEAYTLKRFISFAVSITLPPPTARNASGRIPRAKSMAVWTLGGR